MNYCTNKSRYKYQFSIIKEINTTGLNDECLNKWAHIDVCGVG